jgi:hypothetical protein
LRFGFLLQQKVVEMATNTFKGVFDNIQPKCQAGLDEMRSAFEVSVTGFFRVAFMTEYTDVMVIGTFVCAFLSSLTF